jgi:predicted nucleic acid-binding protein
VTRYLVDTNVISATAPVRRPELIEWMDSHSRELFLLAVTIAEIAGGHRESQARGCEAEGLLSLRLARPRRTVLNAT